MAVGRFLAMIGMLVWRRDDGRYLLLRRASTRDYAPGQWETGSGRLEQGEGFIDALRRESREELGREVRIECILGATHFYRGDAVPENEMVGLSFGCSIPDAAGLRVSDEHSEHRWVTADDATGSFPSRPLAAGTDSPGRGATESNAGRVAKAALGGRPRVLTPGELDLRTTPAKWINCWPERGQPAPPAA